MTEYDVERRAATAGLQHESPVVSFRDDPARQRQPDPPPLLLRREPRLEDPLAQLARHARTVVLHAHTHLPFRQLLHRQRHAPAAPRERIDRVLRERLDRPFEQHWIARDLERVTSEHRSYRDGLRQRRNARAEVAGDALDDLAEIDTLAPQRAA